MEANVLCAGDHRSPEIRHVDHSRLPDTNFMLKTILEGWQRVINNSIGLIDELLSDKYDVFYWLLKPRSYRVGFLGCNEKIKTISYFFLQNFFLRSKDGNQTANSWLNIFRIHSL